MLQTRKVERIEGQAIGTASHRGFAKHAGGIRRRMGVTIPNLVSRLTIGFAGSGVCRRRLLQRLHRRIIVRRSCDDTMPSHEKQLLARCGPLRRAQDNALRRRRNRGMTRLDRLATACCTWSALRTFSSSFANSSQLVQERSQFCGKRHFLGRRLVELPALAGLPALTEEAVPAPRCRRFGRRRQAG